MSWTAKVQFLAEVRNLSLFHSVQTGSGAHPASYSMSNEVSFLGDKADKSPPSCIEVKKRGNIIPLPHRTS
jgi:hypothetical protein